jgi:long-subunit fatty acid transport protein
MVSRRLLRLGLLAAIAFPAMSTARANPLDTFGFGSREVSLGGAVGADVEDASAAYYNPAGLAGGSELRISMGYTRTHSSLTIGGTDSALDPVAGTNFGIVAPIPIGTTRLAFGVTAHLPDNRISRTRSVLLDHPRWELYDTRPHKIFLATSVAFQPVPWLRFGGGITFQSPSALELNLRGQADFFMPEASTLEHEFRGNLLSIRYPHAGVQVEPNDQISFGLTYRGRLRVEQRLNAVVDGDITGFTDPIPVDFTLLNVGVSTFFPQEVVVSIAARPIPSLRIGFDLQWLDWSQHPSLIANDTVTLALQLPPGFSLNLPGEIRGRKPIPMGMRDRWVPRIGVEWRALENDTLAVDVRGGYAYERTPFPAQQGATNFVDNTRHAISLGAGLELRDLEPTVDGALRFDAHFVYYALPNRVHDKLSPIDPVGDYVSGGHQIGFGLQMEVLFR